MPDIFYRIFFLFYKLAVCQGVSSGNSMANSNVFFRQTKVSDYNKIYMCGLLSANKQIKFCNYISLLLTSYFGLWTSFCYAFGSGTTSASFLKYAAGSRSTAMGEAYTAVAEDSYSTYWNPAGLGSVRFPEVGTTYTDSFQDINHQFLVFVYPLKYDSTIGASWTRLGLKPFQGYDAKGWKTNSISSFDFSIGLGYGRTILKDEAEKPILNAGIMAKTVQEKLDNVQAIALATDIGAIYYRRPTNFLIREISDQEFRFALAIRNLGTKFCYDKYSFSLPTSLNLGIAWLGHIKNKAFTVAVDQTFFRGEQPRTSLGLEYFVFNILALRAGYKTNQDMGSGLRAGVGFAFSSVNIDYALSPFDKLGNMHKVGVSVKFGASKQQIEGEKQIAPKKTKFELFAEEYIARAKKNLEDRQYSSAIDNIIKATNLDPKLLEGEWGHKEKRLSEIVNNLKIREMPQIAELLAKKSEQSNLMHESIMAYIEGKNTKALLLAEASFGTNPIEGSVFEKYLNLISNLTEIKIRRDEILPITALIEEKFKKAVAAFYVQKFEIAIQELSEIVLIDENNELAWTRLGSVYYAMDEKAKAKEAYEKVIKINPNNKSVLEFMKIQGW